MATGRRGRPPGSPNKVKADKPTQGKTAGAQSGPTLTSPNVYHQHKEEIAEKREILNKAQTGHATAYKAAEKNGLDREVLQFVGRLGRMTDSRRGEFLRILREYSHIEGWDQQPDLFEQDEPSRPPASDRDPVAEQIAKRKLHEQAGAAAGDGEEQETEEEEEKVGAFAE